MYHAVSSSQHAINYLAHQNLTPCAVKKASAFDPSSMASVLNVPACVQVSAATVIERGAFATGQPLRASNI